jgi:hypothetical protein
MELHDVYSRFARRHLGTREERAVYLTLVGQEAGSWSVRDLAKRSHLNPDDTERVLEEFEAAGVVEVIDTREGRRYRWRSDMNYLFGEGDGGTPPTIGRFPTPPPPGGWCRNVGPRVRDARLLVPGWDIRGCRPNSPDGHVSRRPLPERSTSR